MTQVFSNNQSEPEKSAPLYVDLDGTLVETDTLHESLLGLFKKNPFMLFGLFVLWLGRGRAALKEKVASLYLPDPTLLPYNQGLLSYLKEERQKGREIVLASAADKKVVTMVAEHLQIFDGVLASENNNNLKGLNKLKAIKLHCQGHSFGYAGDSQADVSIWKEAAEIILAGRNQSIIKKKFGRLQLEISRDFSSEMPCGYALIKAIRPYQWVKNLLLFVSIVLAHQVNQSDLLLSTVFAFASFCACASGVYLLNDLLDIQADRYHKVKKARPLASGALPIKYGVVGVPFCLLVSGILAFHLPATFQLILLCYFVLTSGYTFYLKRLVLLDVIILSLLYTLRIIAGSAAIGISTTPWLLGFSIFLFLSLALAKRYSELHGAIVEGKTQKLHGRGYKIEDVEQLAVFGSCSGYISILVLALYLNSSQVSQLYSNVEFLWMVCPLLIYWVSRIWLLARRGDMHEDPVVFTLHDKVSYAVGAIVGVLLVLAMM